MDASQITTFFSHIRHELSNVPNEIRRLFHGRGRVYSGLEQLTCDWVDNQLLINIFKPVDNPFIEELKNGLHSLSQTELWRDKGVTCAAIQYRYLDGSPLEIVVGELNDRPIVVESGINYQLNIGRNQNFGLFLDMRLGRDWVKSNSENKTVLNLFAYTCGFSVAAIEGGAKQVVNVDMARASLTKGRDNHRLNGHNLDQVKFLAYDIFKSWGKIKKLGPYDLVIIDPPSFQKGSFALSKDYIKIIRRLPELLADKGQVLACVNSPQVSGQFLIESMQEAAPQLTYTCRLENPTEFADIDTDAALKVMLFE
ncbi:methyltransferase domain-containing protein [Vibrio pectenicida]|uniref:Methyltransferase domain-containing protein n=1 Tax=Vibrio pectenicida TaxID=62763 RepID=A0A7Y4EE11_9VIBR|nr:class I SAM-dependent methyltransferase [Vibrio pectenicida]NOH71269.1 methyltransferase domain-containing protein [Vibrio pectenicida]